MVSIPVTTVSCVCGDQAVYSALVGSVCTVLLSVVQDTSARFVHFCLEENIS